MSIKTISFRVLWSRPVHRPLNYMKRMMIVWVCVVLFVSLHISLGGLSLMSLSLSLSVSVCLLCVCVCVWKFNLAKIILHDVQVQYLYWEFTKHLIRGKLINHAQFIGLQR